MKINLSNLIISVNKNQEKEILKEIEKAGIKKENIKNIKYLRRSIDSRKKNDIKFVYNLELDINGYVNIDKNPKLSLSKEFTFKKRIKNNRNNIVAVIGTGPAGLFAALRLTEYGYTPLIFERGECVEERDKTVNAFILGGELNEDSNIQFGEGGAGTYSDGKLNTRIKSEYIDKVFRVLIDCGADNEIFWNYKPHIGTDILRIVTKNLREKIISQGGKFFFDTKLEDITIKNNKIYSITVKNVKNLETRVYEIENLILAIGHSSRETYKMLHRKNIKMENKAFAVGLRIEHRRSDIDFMQYGKNISNPLLEAATYNYTYHNKQDNRGTFSFCMCPGGEIINASSEKNGTLVNGMSFSKRNGLYSNSAIITAISEKDYGTNLFDGLLFQEKLEQKAFNIAHKGAIYQNVLDFLNNKNTDYQIESSYKMNLVSYNFKDFFPDVISDNLHLALQHWSKDEIFISKNVNLIGPETRTSAPIKILRDEIGESVSVKGIFPIGEGAGYAGGITSAAVDGLKIVDLAFAKVIE